MIRNQQVTRSSRVAGSNLLNHFRKQVILGIRAFGTQLLCEQVIGRALRRQSYELNEHNLFDAEYADTRHGPVAAAIVAPVALLAARNGSSIRCAYRCVVAAWVCPSSAPMIGSVCPLETATEANDCRRS